MLHSFIKLSDEYEATRERVYRERCTNKAAELSEAKSTRCKGELEQPMARFRMLQQWAGEYERVGVGKVALRESADAPKNEDLRDVKGVVRPEILW